MVSDMRPDNNYCDNQCSDGSDTYPGKTLVFLSLGVFQPLHEFGVSEQVSVQRAVFGKCQLSCVLGQCGALIVSLHTQTHRYTQ